MKQYEVGFIGCGNMGSALLRAISKVLDGKTLAICEHHPSKSETLKNELGCDILETPSEILTQCKVVFLAIKPQGYPALCTELAPVLKAQPIRERPLLISMAAGLSISRVMELLQVDVPLLRIMPNTPVACGKGLILYAKSALVTEEQEKQFLNLLSCAGTIDSIDESKMDAAAALSGCGPAYAYLFMESLADGAVACGVPREKALLYAAETLRGSAEMLLTSKKHPGELKDAVCSPGGTTIEGVKALEKGAFRYSCMEAVIEAFCKTKDLQK